MIGRRGGKNHPRPSSAFGLLCKLVAHNRDIVLVAL
jgi:hypothetical protein